MVETLPAQRPKTCVAYRFPERCPVCGSRVAREAGEVDSYCTGGLICSAQVVERLKHFASRDAFDIEGLGDKNIEAFYRNGLIKTPVDIFTLEARDGQQLPPLREWEGWGEKSARKLFDAVRRARVISLDRFIYALGIRQIGEATARLLAKHYRSLAHWRACMEGSQDRSSEAYFELCAINGIGARMADDILEFIAEPHNRDVLDGLTLAADGRPPLVSVTESERQAFASPVSGKTVVFTGALESMSRGEAKSQAEALGANVAGAVSRKTDYVVAGPGAGSKEKRARELGLTVLTEQQWKDLIGSGQ